MAVVQPTLTVYPGQSFTAQDFALTMDRISIIKSGIIYGCVAEQVGSAAQIKVNNGWAIIRGRLVKVNESIFESIPSGETHLTVMLNIDLANGSAPCTLTLDTDATVATKVDSADFNYNTSTGVAYLALAEATINASTITITQITEPEVGTVRTLTIATTDWSDADVSHLGPWYRVNDNRITSTSHQELLPPAGTTLTKAMNSMISLADIHDGGQGAGYVDLVCYGVKPSDSITLRMLFRGAI